MSPSLAETQSQAQGKGELAIAQLPLQNTGDCKNLCTVGVQSKRN